MIDINLVPPQSRRKKRKNGAGGFQIPPEIVIGAGGGLVLLLVAAHVILLFINLTELARQGQLNAQWTALQPRKKKVDAVLAELRQMQSTQRAVQAILKKEEVTWAQRLNIISDVLPRGVWLRQINLSPEHILFVQGSALTLESQEMINVHTLAANLKKNEYFINGFAAVELGSIERRKIMNTEITDFVITAKMKNP
ncbi:MAG: PilN domain-containing protein [Candidatus Omnitrophica bacterium]|nr:PilN domain-containing protein [Candidatus Omnitrophota bacterium]